MNYEGREVDLLLGVLCKKGREAFPSRCDERFAVLLVCVSSFFVALICQSISQRMGRLRYGRDLRVPGSFD